jgi:hypothetical protein
MVEALINVSNPDWGTMQMLGSPSITARSLHCKFFQICPAQSGTDANVEFQLVSEFYFQFSKACDELSLIFDKLKLSKRVASPNILFPSRT